jgi:hypothetical protein
MPDTSLYCADTSSRIYTKVNDDKGELESFLMMDGEAPEPIIINKVNDGFETSIYYRSDNSIYLALLSFPVWENWWRLMHLRHKRKLIRSSCP